jgi:hypothetical protein
MTAKASQEFGRSGVETASLNNRLIRYYKTINSAKKAGKWEFVEVLSTKALSVMPKSHWYRHWFYVSRALAYYHQDKLTHALKDSRIAVSREPTCPYAMHSHGLILYEIGRSRRHKPSLKECIDWLTRLTTRGTASIMKDKCAPRTAKDAKEYANDAYYTLGLANWNLGDLRKTRSYFKKYIQGRESKLGSAWNLRHVKMDLRELEQEMKLVKRG